jgi:hypothetical protein
LIPLDFHVVPEHRVNGGLIAFPLPTKEAKYVRIEPQSDLFLLARPSYGVCKKVAA